MASIRLKFVKAYVDRHGRARHYFRKPGCKSVTLPGLPGSPEFMDAYSAAVAAESPRVEIGASRTRARTIAAVSVGYFGSVDFANLAPSSQKKYRRIIEHLRSNYGSLSTATMQRAHVQRMLDAKAATPSEARSLLICLRALMAYAVAIGVRQDDPTAGIKAKVRKGTGYTPWTEDDVATFERAYPVGSKQRLAFVLLLETGLRAVDVVRVGRPNMRGGTLRIVTQKTGTEVAIPVSAKLAEAIAAAPADHLVFLINENGRPFTAKAFGAWFSAQCRRVGLALSPHGVRKFAATRMANSGASAHELMAYFGWSSIGEAERYTRAANRERLARSAAERTRNVG
jgi:integrase